MRVFEFCFIVAALCGLTGMALGIWMGMNEDFTLAPAHAHVNLLGWVTLALYGLYHRGVARPSDRLAWVQVVSAALGVPLLSGSFAGVLATGTHAAGFIVAGGAGVVLVVLGMVLFLAVLLADLGARRGLCSAPRRDGVTVVPAEPSRRLHPTRRSRRRPPGRRSMPRKVRTMRLAYFCFVAAALSGLTGMSLGVWMGVNKDFSLAPVHAHVNLLGWATLALYGLYHRGVERASDRLAWAQAALGASAVPLMTGGLAAYLTTYADGFEPLIIAGALSAITSMFLFFVVVLTDMRRRRAPSRRTLGRAPMPAATNPRLGGTIGAPR